MPFGGGGGGGGCRMSGTKTPNGHPRSQTSFSMSLGLTALACWVKGGRDQSADAKQNQPRRASKDLSTGIVQLASPIFGW